MEPDEVAPMPAAKHWLLLLPALLLGLAPGEGEEPGPAADPRESADLVVLGKVYTGDPRRPRASMVAVSGDRIVHVGESSEVGRWVTADTRVVRSRRGSVLPGFNDAHCHFTVGFGKLHDLDLSAATSLEEILELLAAHVRGDPAAEVIQGMGWDLADMPDHAYPTAAMLDEVVDDVPVVLWSDGPHGAWLNTLALDRAGITSETPSSASLIVVSDEEGEPSGVLLGRLLGLFDFLPFPDVAEMKAGIREGMREANRLGVTSVQESVSPFLIPYLAELHDEGELTVRFHVWGSPTPSPFGGGPAQHEELAAEHGREDWITFGTLKTGVDGMPGLRTAAMLEPYADDPSTTGLLTVGAEALAATVRSVNERGLRVAVHACGDAGVRMSANAFAASHGETGVRNRVEHAFLVDRGDIETLARARAVVSVQPAFLTLDLAKDRFYEKRFGLERCADLLPLRALLDAGVTLAFGTDFSLTPLDPLVGLYAAVTRTTLGGEPEDGWMPAERITLEEAIDAYTHGSAVAEGAAGNKGRIAVGQLADMVVFDNDVFALQPEDLIHARHSATIVGGRVVHRE
jgi:predicted amidohydrolase YtcJ